MVLFNNVANFVFPGKEIVQFFKLCEILFICVDIVHINFVYLSENTFLILLVLNYDSILIACLYHW